MLPSMRNDLILFSAIMGWTIWYIVNQRRLSSGGREARRRRLNHWFSSNPIYDRAIRIFKWLLFVCTCLYPMVVIRNFKESMNLLRHYGSVALLEMKSERSEGKYKLMLYNGTSGYIYFHRDVNGVVSHTSVPVDAKGTGDTIKIDSMGMESSLEPSNGACGTCFYIPRGRGPVKVGVRYWTVGEKPETNVVWTVLE